MVFTKTKLSGKQFSFGLNHLPPGIYILEIHEQNLLERMKILIK
jgi:hypothetical protein